METKSHPLWKWPILSPKETFSQVYQSKKNRQKSWIKTICLHTHFSNPSSINRFDFSALICYLNAPISTRRKRTTSQNSRVVYFPSNKHSKVKWPWQHAFFSLLAKTARCKPTFLHQNLEQIFYRLTYRPTPFIVVRPCFSYIDAGRKAPLKIMVFALECMTIPYILYPLISMRWCAELSTQLDGPKVRRSLAPSISQQLVYYKINVCYAFPVILYHKNHWRYGWIMRN